MGTSVASFLVLGGGGGQAPQMYRQNFFLLKCASERSERAPIKHIFSGLKIHLHTYNQCSSLLLLLAWCYIYDSIMIKHYSLRKIYEYASERSLDFFFAFSHSKTAISFNILLVLMILCLGNIYFQVSNYICILSNKCSFLL